MEEDISPTSNDRGIVIGQTGAGKTFFMRYLLKDVQRLMVLDPKGTLYGPKASGGDWHLKEWDRRTAKAIRRGAGFRVRIPHHGGKDPWRAYLEAFYRGGNAMLYIDEMNGVVPPRTGVVPDELNAIYTRGRELGLGAWSASQRPAWIPLEVMSEAQWFVLFRVLLDEDRKRMAGLMGPQVLTPIEDDFGFWVRHVSWREPRYYSGLEVERAA